MSEGITIGPWQALPAHEKYGALHWRIHQNSLVPDDSFLEFGQIDRANGWVSPTPLFTIPFPHKDRTLGEMAALLEFVAHAFTAGMRCGAEQARYKMRKAIGAL